jgi:pSer/pThr/pTyr-binding forkhead associated (FHA) protein
VFVRDESANGTFVNGEKIGVKVVPLNFSV